MSVILLVVVVNKTVSTSTGHTAVHVKVDTCWITMAKIAQVYNYN